MIFGYDRVNAFYVFVKDEEYTILNTFSPLNDINLKVAYTCDIKENFVQKKLILMGAGASGKDYMKSKLISYGMKSEVSYTTRPQRVGEVDGVDYNFVDKDEFESMIIKDEFIQWNKFGNGHYYGTSKSEFEKCDLFIMTPSALSSMTPSDRKRSFVIWINIDEDIRRKRLEERDDKNDSLERRLTSDRDDFNDFNDYDYIITNENFII